MSQHSLQQPIEELWEQRESLSSSTKGAARDAVEAALDALDNGNANVAVSNRTVVRYVIERMCLNGANGKDATREFCDMPEPPSVGTTVHDASIPIPPSPLYRVTIRVDGPQNSTSFLQAMLREHE